MNGSCTSVWTNARLATFQPERPGIGEILEGAVATSQGRIVYAGPAATMPAQFRDAPHHDCDGRWVTPGLIDCHTHLVHAGNRSHEFALRLAGATYEEIARAGGGIVSSVKAVREATVEQLVNEALPRLDALISEGVTTVEIKSGYGLSIEDEAKMLRAARTLGEQRKVSVRTTYLAAHATPSHYKGRNRDYIVQVVIPGMAAAANEGLIDAVDGFCEGIAFSPDEIRLVFEAAKSLGLPVKLHAEQLSNLGGAALAAEYGALSADHLEYVDDRGCAALAASGTVAVLLPGAFYFIRETRKPPVALFRQHGVSMALATDNNPGSSPLTSLLLAMNMGATLFGMTIDECLAGVTREAAKALGMAHDMGTIAVGKKADMAIWNIAHPAELVYRMGFNPLHRRIVNGVMDP